MNKKIDIYKTQKKKLNIENPKKVSVIIPNYNYQKYIIERIDSILLQTYPIYEIIILDDCSTDNSVQIIEEKIKTIPKEIKVQFIKNEKNSGGCVFKQWKKGFDAATGDFIWIAEADDSAESTFVEELIKPFDDEEVILSYCESARIDGENNLIREKSDDLYDMCRTGEWGKSYIWTGKEENIYHLSVTNTILNVSSVMWRKKDYTKIFEEAGEFKVAGDWYIYSHILKDGKISWNNKALNYYRKHGSSVCTDIKWEIEYSEICKIQDEISSWYELPEEVKKKQEMRRDLMRQSMPPKDSGKKKIAWVMPHPGKGSGGHRTIIQNVNALIRAGYECDIYVEEDGVSTPQTVKDKINNWYEKCDAGVYVGMELKKEYDIVFATGWQVINFVRRMQAKKKAYFIQDFEPWFFPMGDQYLIIENSYRYGYKPVTIGKWLAHKMLAEFDTPVQYFDFGADLNTYKKLDNVKKENAICFVYQPEKPRRCDYIGLKALKIVKALRPDIQIYLYGSSAPATFEFECKNLNIIPIKECNELYNKCMVGICMSSSNPSRIPFEMMAAGLPVVELYRENNLYDLPDEGVLLAEPSPEAVANAIIYLVDHPEVREKMSKFGPEFMKDYPLEKGFTQFLKAVDDIINTDYNDRTEIKPLYKKGPFKASEETTKAAIDGIEPIRVDEHGAIYRFLRRVKRFLKNRIKEIKKGMLVKMEAILRKIKKGLKALTITNLKAVLRYIKHNGFKGLYTTCINKIRFGAVILDEYETWRANNEPTSEELEKQKSYTSCQNISFELVYKEENSSLEDSIQSLTYTNFKKTKIENNDFLNIIQNSTSDYIVFIGKNIVLAPFSLYELVRSIEYRDSIMLYSDNDTIIDGKRTMPNFKPDFAKDTLRSENYIGNFLVVKTKFLKIHSDILKNLNKNFIYDIAFRVSEKTRRIEHIPKILFNNLSKEMDYDTEDEKKIIAEHLQRCNTPFDKIEDGRYKGQYKIQYTIIGNPKISIVIPNKDHIADLEKAIQSIMEKSTYKNYEIVIVENNSTEKETFSYYEKIQKEYPEKIRVAKFEIDYFNYSATVNFGVENANRRICNIIK